jgi:8-oxo-dGTP pyrophosphatase MutT (NUDIX family)
VPVSGKVDPSDRDLASALSREVLEETGFSEFLRVFSLDWHVRFDGADGRAWRLHAYALELAEPKPPRLSAEHEAFEWAGFEEAQRRLHYADNREAVDRLAAQVLRAGDPKAAPKV